MNSTAATRNALFQVFVIETTPLLLYKTPDLVYCSTNNIHGSGSSHGLHGPLPFPLGKAAFEINMEPVGVLRRTNLAETADMIRQMVRRLSRALMFTAVTVMTIAVAIGANAAVF